MMHLLYIDPGSSSYLIQVIIAAVLGVLFYFKNAWQWIKSFFIKAPKKTDEDQNEPSDQ
jgi:hypothetical protein